MKCSQDGCERIATTKGLCRAHYGRMRKGAPMAAPIKQYVRNKGRTCSIPGCVMPARCKSLCRGHLERKSNAKKAGTLHLSDWMRPLEARMCGVEFRFVRLPEPIAAALKQYAEELGIEERAAIVKIVERHFWERQGAAVPDDWRQAWRRNGATPFDGGHGWNS